MRFGGDRQEAGGIPDRGTENSDSETVCDSCGIFEWPQRKAGPLRSLTAALVGVVEFWFRRQIAWVISVREIGVLCRTFREVSRPTSAARQ